MRVDGNISDLFFNTEHHADQNGDHDELIEEANHFLSCLERLGVDAPTKEELIQDFYDRI